MNTVVDINFRSIFDEMDHLVYISNPETYEILYVNKKGEDLFPGNILEKKCYEAIHNFNSPCSFCTNNLLFGDNPISPLTWIYYDKKNNKWSHCIDQAIRWKDGKNVRFEIAIEITAEKKMEQKLKESEERFQMISKNINDVIWTMDKDLNLTYIAPSSLKLYGYTVEEMIDIPLIKINTPSSLEKISQALKEEIEKKNGEGKDLSTVRVMKLEQIHKNGSILNVEMAITVLRDINGEITQILGVTRDLTKRRETEQKLRESEYRWNTLVRNIPDVIYNVDREGKFLSFNKPVTIGLSTEALIGKSVYDYITPAHAVEMKKKYENVFQTGEYDEYIEKGPGPERKDSRWYRVRLIPLKKEGQVESLLQIATDITESLKTEQKLRESEEKLKEFNEELEHIIEKRTKDLKISEEKYRGIYENT